MANIYKGVGCHWGVGSTTHTLTNGKLQTRDHTLKSEGETIRDPDGVTISKVYYDKNEEGTFECVVTGSAGTGNASVTLPTIGDAVVITDTTYYQISGSATGGNTWCVDDISTKGSNTSCMRVTLRLTRFENLIIA